MKYSIIIPTMYFHIEQLSEMLTVYNAMQSVGEILIVNNNKEKAVEFGLSKVRTIGDGVNKYVNPSWKFGVENAKYENVVLANDDITIRGDIKKLFESVLDSISDNRVFGPAPTCFFGFGTTTSRITIQKQFVVNPHKISHGFGVLMFMKKEVFTNTNIPEDFLVWYGDHIICLTNEPWQFSGVKIITGMRGTTSKMNLSMIALMERRAFKTLSV